MQVIDHTELDRLIRLLQADGYEVIGPTVRDGAIMYGPVAGIEQAALIHIFPDRSGGFPGIEASIRCFGYLLQQGVGFFPGDPPAHRA